MESQTQSFFEDDAVSFPPYGVATFENEEPIVRWCHVTKRRDCEFCFDKRYTDEEMITAPRQSEVGWSVNINDDGNTTKR